VERRCIDELWRKKWRRKKVGRGRLVEEAKGVSKKSRKGVKMELQVADECGRVQMCSPCIFVSGRA
jgi:hypothetical protein